MYNLSSASYLKIILLSSSTEESKIAYNLWKGFAGIMLLFWKNLIEKVLQANSKISIPRSLANLPLDF